MKKYNRDKRATHNAQIDAMKHTHDNGDARDTQDRRARIHISIKYDGYAQAEYVKIIHGKTRDTRAQRYIGTTNAINDIFPDINAPHNAHTYRGTAPYRKYPQRDNTPEGIFKRMSERAHAWQDYIIENTPHTIHKDTRTVKCIILNDDDRIIYIGKMRRTRVVNVTRGTIDITLHRNDREMHAYERAIDPDRIIHGLTVREIKTHEVEFYYI